MINYTNSKAKDILFTLEFEEKLSEAKRLKAFRKLHKKWRRPPPSLYKYPIYQPLKVVIICTDLSKVCPRRWDELEVDIKNCDTRYCDISKEDVVKVTNMYNYNKIKDKNTTIAIPTDGIPYHVFDGKFNDYVSLYIFIQMARRVIQGMGYSKNRDIHNSNLESVLEWVFENISFNNEIDKLKKLDVDLSNIINIIYKGNFSDKLKNIVSSYC